MFKAISIAFNSSGLSNAAPSMTRKDTKIILNNVADLALFSDLFTGRLGDSLGKVLKGGAGQDCVRALYLEMVRTFQACSDVCLTCKSRLDPTPRISVRMVHHATRDTP